MSNQNVPDLPDDLPRPKALPNFWDNPEQAARRRRFLELREQGYTDEMIARGHGYSVRYVEQLCEWRAPLTGLTIGQRTRQLEQHLRDLKRHEAAGRDLRYEADAGA